MEELYHNRAPPSTMRDIPCMVLATFISRRRMWQMQGITLRPCLVHLHIWASNFSISAYRSFYTCLSAHITNKLEFNSIKFHEFICKNWEILVEGMKSNKDRSHLPKYWWENLLCFWYTCLQPSTPAGECPIPTSRSWWKNLLHFWSMCLQPSTPTSGCLVPTSTHPWTAGTVGYRTEEQWLWCSCC